MIEKYEYPTPRYFMGKLSLNEAAKLTNTTYPVQEYIQSNVFPEQDVDKLLTTIWIKYRDFRNNSVIEDGKTSYRNMLAPILVLRYDKVFPYITIGMGVGFLHKGIIFVVQRKDDSDIMDNIAVVPEQQYRFYDIQTRNTYWDDLNKKTSKEQVVELVNFPSDDPDWQEEERKWITNRMTRNGTILRCDSGEPAFSVIMEVAKLKMDFETNQMYMQLRCCLADEILSIVPEESTVVVRSESRYIEEEEDEDPNKYRPENDIYEAITKLIEAGATMYGMPNDTPLNIEIIEGGVQEEAAK